MFPVLLQKKNTDQPTKTQPFFVLDTILQRSGVNCRCMVQQQSPESQYQQTGELADYSTSDTNVKNDLTLMPP